MARTMAFTAVSTYERAARNGQPLYYSSIHEVTLARPDKLRVITPGDGTPDEFYYDGKTMMAYVPSKNVVAVSDAPPTIDQLLDHAWEKAAIYFPFADVLASDPAAELGKQLKSAFYVGRSIAVGGAPDRHDRARGRRGGRRGVDRRRRPSAAPGAGRLRQRTGAGPLPDSVLRLAARTFPVTASMFVNPKALHAEHIDFAPPGDAEAPAATKEAPAEKKP